MLNEQHASFDRAMELLCLLGPEPWLTFRSEAASDLMLDDQFESIDVLRRELRRRGIRTVGSRVRGRLCLSVRRRCWPIALAIGEEYWSEVYSGDEVDAGEQRHEAFARAGTLIKSL